MNLHQVSTANLRKYYRDGRISEQEFTQEIERRENEQADIREQERLFGDAFHPNRLPHMFPADK